MYKYAKDFPIKIIPHITENQEINDIIHNYRKSAHTNTQNPSSTNKPPLAQSNSIPMNLLQNG